MSRFLLLFLFLIWMACRSEIGAAEPTRFDDLTLFFGLYAFLVLVLGIWSRLLARRVSVRRVRKQLAYFNHVLFGARFFIPVWFGIGVFMLGWGAAVQKLMGPVNNWPVQLPAAIVGTLPAMLAWIGLWWAQFPADRALREQNVFAQIDADLPVHLPPPFKDFFFANLRLQLLFTVVPILFILLFHDIAMMFLWRVLRLRLEGSAAEGIVSFLSAGAVFFMAPVILRRVLNTEPLRDGELRRRLEQMCKAHRLKYRNILLWRTNNNMGNAAVMGIAAPVRYILLSDLLLQTMSEEQIEAVFAHEVGHVVHRHMVWYLVFMQVLILALAAVGMILEAQEARLHLPPWLPLDRVMSVIGVCGFIIAFGFISRRFERQADVYAARVIQGLHGQRAGLTPTPVPPHKSHVGLYGADIFNSALRRVAQVNNIPMGVQSRFAGGLWQRLGFVLDCTAIAVNNWLHGSISSRMRTLQRMSADPSHTFRFDRFMAKLYVAMLVALLVSGAGAWLANARISPSITPPAQAAALR